MAARFVGEVDSLVHAIAEAEFFGEPQLEVAELKAPARVAHRLDEFRMIILAQVGGDLRFKTEAAPIDAVARIVR